MQIFNFLTILGLLLFGLIIYDLNETNLNKSTDMLSQIRSYPLLLLSMNFWPPTLVSAFSFSIFGLFFVGAPFVAVKSLWSISITNWTALGFYTFRVCTWKHHRWKNSRPIFYEAPINYWINLTH